MALAVGDYGDTILVAVGSIKGTGEDSRLLEAGRNISSTYGKKVEIISVAIQRIFQWEIQRLSNM